MITSEHIQELQRFAELGRLSASLLHEISSPLTAAIINLELSGEQSAGVRRARRDMQLLRRYVEAARRQLHRHGRTRCFSVPAQLGQLKRIVSPLAHKNGVRLEIAPPPDGVRLRGDPVKFLQIATNLVINATEAYEPAAAGRHRTAVVRVSWRRQKGTLTMCVRDWGSGIAAADLPRLFETFYTTKTGGRGLGLGLAIVHRYVTNDFGGSISVTSSRRRGTCFTVRLPVAATAGSAAGADAAVRSSRAGP